jgi:hypothetical protein
VTLSQKTLTGDAGTSKDITVTVTPEGAPQDVAIAPVDAKIATAVKKNGNTYTVSLVASGATNIDFVADKVKSTLAVTVNAPK